MSDNKEATKEIKIAVDDETVERLVENRFTEEGNEQKSRSRKPASKKHKKRKKKHIVLKTLIVILAFILTFVVSFLVSYTYFTNQNEKKDTYTNESASTTVTETVGELKELEASESAEYTPQPDEVFVEEEKPVSKDEKAEKEESKKPASSAQTKPSTAKPEAEKTEKEPSSDIIDNEENSEGLDLGI